eukprot:952323-Rhodomonas_salina.2
MGAHLRGLHAQLPLGEPHTRLHPLRACQHRNPTPQHSRLSRHTRGQADDTRVGRQLTWEDGRAEGAQLAGSGARNRTVAPLAAQFAPHRTLPRCPPAPRPKQPR